MYLQTLFITKEGRFYICRLLYVHVLFLFHMIILLIEGLCKYDVINDLYLLILSKIQNPFHISHMPQKKKGIVALVIEQKEKFAGNMPSETYFFLHLQEYI